MSFQSLGFLAFLMVTLAVCLPAGRRSPRAGAALLTIASAVFYLLGPGGWAVVLGGLACLLLGIAVTAWAIRRMARSGSRRRTLALACVYHIAVLVGFKYTEFLTGGAVEVGWAPLGLSFFTFQQLWLLKEVYTGEYVPAPGDSLLLYGLCTVLSEWKHIQAPAVKKLGYVLTFPIFMLTYIPISIAALVRKVEWKPIYHTATKKVGGMG